MRVLDLRAEQPNPPQLQKPKHWVRNGRVVERDPATIDCIVLHQTACVFGKRADQPTRHHRALGVACHALAFNDGVVVLPNPLRWYVQHGNGFNATSLGLEVEGVFPGIAGDPKTLPKNAGPETPLTDTLILTARLAVRVLMEQAAIEGITIRRIVAHRQSSATRRADPGSALWKAVVVEHAVPVLGLRVEPDLVLVAKNGRPGRPIPAAWGGPAGYRY